MEIFYPFRFIAVASRGYKNWLQFEQHYTHSVFNFYFFGKKFAGKCPDTYSTWSQLRSMDAKARVSTLRATRPWRRNLCALPLVRCKTIDPVSTTSSEPYNRNVTLQTLELFFEYVRLYNAAASPASRLRSAGSLAIVVFYLLIVNSYSSVHIARQVWTWCNMIKQFFSTCYLTFFPFMQWDYDKFILKQLDYSPSFSTSDSQLGCASLTICS